MENVKFKQEIPDEFLCNVCKIVMLDPVMLKCGHTIGRNCVEEIRKKSLYARHCTECRCQFDDDANLQKNYSLHQMIGKLSCECKLCKASFTLDGAETHFQLCQEVKVLCDNERCEVRLKRKDSEIHGRQCGYRREKCQNCCHDVHANMMEKHLQEDCPMRLISCPFGCRAEIQRNELNMHLIWTCPEKTIACNIPKCLFVGNKETMQRHMTERAEQHVRLLQHEAQKASEKVLSKSYEVIKEPVSLETFAWKINGFKRIICERVDEGEPLTSSVFVGYNNRRWRLMLFYNIRVGYKLFVQLVASAEPARVRVRFVAEPCPGKSEDLVVTLGEVLLKEGDSFGEYLPKDRLERMTERNDSIKLTLFIETCRLNVN